METTFETLKPSNKSVVIKNGLITGGLLILFSLLIYALGMMQNRTLSYVSFLLLIGGMYIGMKAYRDQLPGGFIAYGKAFSTGFLIGLVASVLVGIYTYLFFKVFDPGAIQLILDTAEETMLKRNPNLSDEQIEMALSMTKRMTQPGWMGIMAIISNTIMSVIIALILAIFIKREDPLSQQM